MSGVHGGWLRSVDRRAGSGCFVFLTGCAVVPLYLQSTAVSRCRETFGVSVAVIGVACEPGSRRPVFLRALTEGAEAAVPKRPDAGTRRDFERLKMGTSPELTDRERRF